MATETEILLDRDERRIAELEERINTLEGNLVYEQERSLNNILGTDEQIRAFRKRIAELEAELRKEREDGKG